VKGTKTQTSTKEGKELKNPDTTGTMTEAFPGENSVKERKMIARFKWGNEEREKTGIDERRGKKVQNVL
jgi:hypothetical protein